MSKTKLLYLLVLAFSLLVTGCSLFESQKGNESTDSVPAAMSGNGNYDTMLAEVTAKQKALSKEGGAWTISDETLEKAAEAAKNKEFDKAIKLLKEVDDEVALAKAQFESQKNAGPHLF